MWSSPAFHTPQETFGAGRGSGAGTSEQTLTNMCFDGPVGKLQQTPSHRTD
jgi:hypothetical protein